MDPSDPVPKRRSDAIHQLFAADVRTRAERIMLRVCGITGGATLAYPVWDNLYKHVPSSFEGLFIWAYAAVAVTFFATLCVLGIKAAGRAAGKRTFGGQFAHTMLRVFLYVFLPCAVITALLVIWAIVTHQPAFS